MLDHATGSAARACSCIWNDLYPSCWKRSGRARPVPSRSSPFPPLAADLLPSFRARERDYLRAEVRFRCEELHPHRIVDELVAALGLLPPTESPLPGRDEVRPVRPM